MAETPAEDKKRRKSICKEVLTAHLTELVSSIQGNVLKVAYLCFEKNLIPEDTYRGILASKNATNLVTAITYCAMDQDECYSKFLCVLKSFPMYKDLVNTLEQDHQDAIDRNHTASCTDASVPSPQPTEHILEPGTCHGQSTTSLPLKEHSHEEAMQEARQKAIKRHLKELIPSVQPYVKIITEQCKQTELISSQIYTELIRSRKDTETRTRLLLKHVRNGVRADGVKFDKFIEILVSRRTWKGIALKIQEVEKSERMKVQRMATTGSNNEPKKFDAASNPSPSTDLEFETPLSTNAVKETANTGDTLFVSGQFPAGKQSDFQMDQRQTVAQEAKLKKLEEENIELKHQLKVKDLKIERLTIKKEELEFTLMKLKLQVANNERRFYDHEERLKDLVNGHNTEINKLKEQVKDLQKTLEKQQNCLKASGTQPKEAKENLVHRTPSSKETKKPKKPASRKPMKSKKTTEEISKKETKQSHFLTKFVEIVIAIFLAFVGVVVLMWLHKHW